MCAVTVLALGIILASVPPVPYFNSVFSVLLKSGYPFIGALFVSRLLWGIRWEEREGSFHPAAFLYTVKKGSMVYFVLLSVIREGLSVEGQPLCHLEGIFM